MNDLFLHAYIAAAARFVDARRRLNDRLDNRNEAGLASVEIAVIVGLAVAAAIAIVAIIRSVGESAASDIKYK